MSKGGPTQDPHRIAQVLVDAAVLGDSEAARLHCVSTRTIERYRAKYGDEPTVAGLVAMQKQSLCEDWIRRTAEARNKILDKVLALVETAGPEDIRDVVGALKIVHDANVSERVVSDGLGLERPGPVGAPGPTTPFGRAAESVLGPDSEAH